MHNRECVFDAAAHHTVHFPQAAADADPAPLSPVAATLRSIASGGDGGALYACGDGGTLLRIQRGATWGWAVEPAPTTANLTAVAVLPTGEALAVGLNATVLHRAPATSQWQLMNRLPAMVAGAALYGVAMISTALAWAVGDGAVVIAYNGAAWVNQTAPIRNATLLGISAFGPSLAVACGYPALLLRWNGTAWRRDTGPRAGSRLAGVWVGGPTVAWVVAADGSVKHSICSCTRLTASLHICKTEPKPIITL